MRLEDRTFTAIEAIQAANSHGDILGKVQGYLEQFGAQSFIVSHLPPPGAAEKPFVLLSGWSDEWSERYFSRNYVQIDPVARNCFRTTEPFLWSDAPFDAENDRLAIKVMNEARSFGMGEGFCVPISTVDGVTGCVSFGGANIELPENARYLVHMLGIYAHGRLRHLDGAKKPDFSHITLREKEVLLWAAHGKTNQDIADILGITERTVLDHFQKIGRKLSTSNRTHTVAQACLHNLISI